MSSAIELLKEMKNKLPLNFMIEEFGTPIMWEGKEAKALGEAIVALEQKENYVIDFIRLEVLHKSKKEQFRVFFKDGTEQVFQKERVGERK